MKCLNPYMGPLAPFPCGQCNPCRFNRRRLWTHRLILESMCHAENSFVTLTYDEANLPPGGTLVPEHYQLWLKRFRSTFNRLRSDKGLTPWKQRFYLVGEYGDVSQRPHYHAALFGVGPELQDLVRETWGLGHVMCGDLTVESAQYICGYVTKKLTSKDDPRLEGRHPEFARMSNRPGIGANAMKSVADALFSDAGVKATMDSNDVPSVLLHGKRQLPLGRYLRRKLMEEIGTDETFNKKRQTQFYAKVRELRDAALLDPENADKGYKEILVDNAKQPALNLETRSKIFTKGRSL